MSMRGRRALPCPCPYPCPCTLRLCWYSASRLSLLMLCRLRVNMDGGACLCIGGQRVRHGNFGGHLALEQARSSADATCETKEVPTATREAKEVLTATRRAKKITRQKSGDSDLLDCTGNSVQNCTNSIRARAAHPSRASHPSRAAHAFRVCACYASSFQPPSSS